MHLLGENSKCTGSHRIILKYTWVTYKYLVFNNTSGQKFHGVFSITVA